MPGIIVNLREIVYFITALIILESAIYVFRLKGRSVTNIVYSLFTGNVAFFTFVLFMISGSDNCENCQWWYNVSIISACLGPPLTLHFTLSVTRKRTAFNPAVITLLYLPAIIFMGVIYRYNYYLPCFNMTDWGWETVLNINSRYAILFIIYSSLLTMAALSVILNWRYHAANEIDRIQSRSLLLPYLAGQAGLLFSPYFIHVENNNLINLFLDVIGSFLFVIFIAGVRYSIERYSFMKITSASSAGDIINGLSDPVFLVEGDGRIIHCNKKGGSTDIREPQGDRAFCRYL